MRARDGGGWGVAGGVGGVARYRKRSLFPVNGVKALVQMCATALLCRARRGGGFGGWGGGA